ncbi:MULTISPECIES: hypothetical protein [Pseudomonas]|jgi:hypothetical protein|uniref:Uncharacterized protein n=1 Tax=Pseudomonas frederiksbergensis TaxID=104087 RepID=A0A0B1Z519_9PSED|nr:MULTISPECIES: hypothetical protein [Pseudomonas]KHK66129.1 hypothetical protein JZ00_04970 [Pseudomonas frederiksbergensis]KJH85424.1 hypothetical protein UG46_17030 [Pseudomonas fluorescens]MBI6617479.1 hypothetical protein [Pseudomonas corrugata]MBI6693299.1 hypothetical protein [Pseudomonas corrugata]WRV66490.1 hypothetical protein VQ575_16550 [Pseudomonas frederiksbergensis]
MPLSRDQTSDPCLFLPPSGRRAVGALRKWMLFEAASNAPVQTSPALGAREPASPKAPPPAELCEHYA